MSQGPKDPPDFEVKRCETQTFVSVDASMSLKLVYGICGGDINRYHGIPSEGLCALPQRMQYLFSS